MPEETLYLKIGQNNVVSRRRVTLGEIGKMECEDPGIKDSLKHLELYCFPRFQGKEKRQVQTFSLLIIIQMIHKKYPGLKIVNLGEADFIIHYMPREEPKAWQLIKTCLICAVLFFGAAFMIMTFNNDVSVPEVFDKFYTQVTGQEASGPTILEICYCIGLPLGILVFYNHIGRKKITDDPTPVQVSMRKYEQDVDTTYMEDSSREGKSIDVD